MYKHLYDSYSGWFQKNGTVYFYSDPHFDDKDQIHLRPDYIGDEEQVKCINKRVTKNDTIIFLGDIGNVDFIRKINGYKILVKGNHDSGNENYVRRIKFLDKDESETLEIYRAHGYKIKPKGEFRYEVDNRLFDEVYEGVLTIGPKLILSHEPLKDWKYGLNIHGHVHGAPTFPDLMHWDVCAEKINYTPVSLNEIVKSGILKNIQSIHREAVLASKIRKD